MKVELDIHDYERKLQAHIRAVKNSSMSEKNKEIIFKFKDFGMLEGLSKPRITKYLEILKIIAIKLDRDFDKATKQDIENFVKQIQEREDYSVWTKQCYKVILKRFYKWLKGNDEEYPEEVKWIKTNIKKSELKLPSEGDLLTEEEIKKLIEVAEHPRDKAFISVLYESGGRVSEIGSLEIGNVNFDEHGAFITINKGKTGSRKLRLIASTPYLVTWIQSHPFKDNKKAPLWISIGCKNHNKLLKYACITSLLRRLFRKANINKRSNPHSFRHAKASFMANHLTEFQMNQYFGWVQGSDMPSVYVHLSGKNLDSAIFNLNGVKQEKEEKESQLKPKTCPRCDTINAYDSKFCCKCAAILDIKTAIEIEEQRKEQEKMRQGSDELMNTLIKDPETQKFLVEKILKLGLADKIKEII